VRLTGDGHQRASLGQDWQLASQGGGFGGRAGPGV